MKQEEFLIKGMHCASCAINIENTLKKESGVIEASVNFISERAIVKFNPEIIDSDKIKKSIENLGYKVEKKKEGKEIRRKLLVILIGLVLTIAIVLIELFFEFPKKIFCFFYSQRLYRLYLVMVSIEEHTFL